MPALITVQTSVLMLRPVQVSMRGLPLVALLIVPLPVVGLFVGLTAVHNPGSPSSPPLSCRYRLGRVLGVRRHPGRRRDSLPDHAHTMLFLGLGRTTCVVTHDRPSRTLAVPRIKGLQGITSTPLGRVIRTVIALRRTARPLAARLAYLPRHPDNRRHECEKHHLWICPAYR